MLFSFAVLPALAQVAETRRPRPEGVYGNVKHHITLTFYIGQNYTARPSDILEMLQANNVSKAVFFLRPGFASGNLAAANALLDRGYTVLPTANAAQYGSKYSPTAFDGICCRTGLS
jgi:hypothetical protein